MRFYYLSAGDISPQSVKLQIYFREFLSTNRGYLEWLLDLPELSAIKTCFSPTNHSGWHSRENSKPSHHKKASYGTDKATRIQYFAMHTQDIYLGSKLLHMSLPSRHLLAPYNLQYLLIFNDKGTRATSNRFPKHCSGIFIVDCEQVNASWVTTLELQYKDVWC